MEAEEAMKEEREKRLRPADILEAMKSDAPVFVGFSERGPVGEPVEIKRWGQYIVKFGTMRKSGFLATSSRGFFINGGGRFYVLNLGERPVEVEEAAARYSEGLAALDALEDIPFIIAPGEHEPEVHGAILEYCERRGTYAILDGPEELIERQPQQEEGTEGEAAGQPAEEGAVEEEEERYENMPKVSSERGLVVFPWIYLKDRVLGNFYIPPTGHVAGILCRLYGSGERPEYSTIEGTVLLRYKFSPEDIGLYSPRGISFLRYPTKHPGLMLYE